MSILLCVMNRQNADFKLHFCWLIFLMQQLYSVLANFLIIRLMRFFLLNFDFDVNDVLIICLGSVNYHVNNLVKASVNIVLGRFSYNL